MAELFRNRHHMFFDITGFSDGIAGFTTRHGGVSEKPFQSLNLGLHVKDVEANVLENRETLAKTLGTRLDQWVFADQVHGKEIVHVTKQDRGKGSKFYDTGIIGTDGLYTREKGIVLALAFADCVPLFFSTKNGELVGIAHAGWKGTVSGIAQEMIHKWTQEEGIAPADINVWIGPSIQKCCYEVDDHVISRVDAILSDNNDRPYEPAEQDGKYMLDLQKLNSQLVTKANVPQTNVHVSNHCTSCEVDTFFSHRKENGQTGRMVAFTMLED